MLERHPDLGALVALDHDAERLAALRTGLERLGLTATTAHGDAARPEQWWDGRPFDRILVDAPCSASGIIRRQPDIKHHRRPEDVDRLARVQQAILSALWPLLARGGRLLYATCSVLRCENDGVLEAFSRGSPEAELRPVAAPWGTPTEFGRQVLPGEDSMDGFYYAVLCKRG